MKTIKNIANKYMMQIVSLILAIIGVFLVLFGTSRYGAGLTPDSFSYISYAKEILKGGGYTHYLSYYTSWPPLFPTLLAFLGLTGVDIFQAARIFNAFVFGAMVYFSSQLFAGTMRSKAIAIFAAIYVLLSIPLLQISVMAWSDPLFALLSLLFIIYMNKYLAKGDRRSFFMVSFVVALSCLQRYVGLGIVLIGCVLMFAAVPNSTLLKKLRSLCVFVFITIIPLALWLIRDQIINGTMFGGARSGSLSPFYVNAVLFVYIITTWFLPHVFWIRAIIGGTLLLLFAWLILRSIITRYKNRHMDNDGFVRILPSAVFIFFYSFLLLGPFISFLVLWDDRFMAPIYIPFIFMIFLGIDDLLPTIENKVKDKKLLKFILTLSCLVCLVIQSSLIYTLIINWSRNGAGGYSTKQWRESPLIKWVQSNTLNGKIYSNAPDAFFCITNKEATMIMNAHYSIAEFRSTLSRGSNYLVWFNEDRVNRKYIYKMNELQAILRIKKIIIFSDGSGIYLIE